MFDKRKKYHVTKAEIVVRQLTVRANSIDEARTKAKKKRGRVREVHQQKVNEWQVREVV